MPKSTFKELVKKRIRKGDNAVDNDLSSDEERWLDNFDAEMRETKPVNLSLLTRRQLLYYLIKLDSKEERNKIIEDYEIKIEELKELRTYITSSAKLNPGKLSGLKDYNVNSSSSSSSLSSTSSNLRRLIKNTSSTLSTHSSISSLSPFQSASQTTLSSTTSTGKKKGKCIIVKQIKYPDDSSPKLQVTELPSLEIKQSAVEQLNLKKELQTEQRSYIEELEDEILSDDVISQLSFSKDSNSSKDKLCITYDEESSRIIKRVRAGSNKTGNSSAKKSPNQKAKKTKTGPAKTSSGPGKSSNRKGKKINPSNEKATSATEKSSNRKGKKIKTAPEKASSAPGKSSNNTSEPETEKVSKNVSKKRKDRCATPKTDKESDYFPSDYEKSFSVASSEGSSKKKKKSSNVRRVTFQSPVSDNGSQVSSEMEELEKRFVRETLKFPYFPERRVLRSSASGSTKSGNGGKSFKTQKQKPLRSSSSSEMSSSDKLLTLKSVFSENVGVVSPKKSSLVSVSSSCLSSSSGSPSLKHSSVKKGTSSKRSISSQSPSGAGKRSGVKK